LQSEQLCLEFAQVYSQPTASVRIFSAYGAGLRRQVMWDICQKAISQKELILQGTGNESRDFVHAVDIAKAVEIICNHAPMQGEVYNLGNGEEVKIKELASKIIYHMRLDNIPQFNGMITKGNPLNWQANITKLSSLGFAPSISLDKGIKIFTNWCMAELANL
jgi:UDP-glucose 4-epimerase